jgi:hypothetical protein
MNSIGKEGLVTMINYSGKPVKREDRIHRAKIFMALTLLVNLLLLVQTVSAQGSNQKEELIPETCVIELFLPESGVDRELVISEPNEMYFYINNNQAKAYYEHIYTHEDLIDVISIDNIVHTQEHTGTLSGDQISGSVIQQMLPGSIVYGCGCKFTRYGHFNGSYTLTLLPDNTFIYCQSLNDCGLYNSWSNSGCSKHPSGFYVVYDTCKNPYLESTGTWRFVSEEEAAASGVISLPSSGENPATGVLPAGNNPGQDGSNTPDSTPGSSLSGADLSAGSLFAAVGLTALVTLFGSVGVALTNGMSLQGAWSELTAFIGSVIPGKVVESPLEAEQAIYPEERFMETPLPEEPLSPMSTGQPTPPTFPQEEIEEFWNKAEKEITEQTAAEEETKPKIKLRNYQTSEEILTEITGPLEELVSQMETDGVQVINLKNSHLIDLMTRTTIDTSDQTKWVRCGDLVDQKIGLIRSLAKEKFGAGAIVDQVAIGEASSLEASSDPVDWIRNRLPYNHTAIRIIAPDGQAYIIDFWQALQGSPLIQTEERWVANWVKEFNPNDLTFQAWRGWSAEEQSAANQIRRIGIEGYRRSMEKKINASGLEKQAKQVKLKELKSFINYYRLRGGRFGYNFGSGYSTRF